jgi:large subunit ribosomal protein L3
MPTRKSPRKGSLQYWPRKRAEKFLPSVNWGAIETTKTLKGFIGYKAGMKSALVKDSTENSMTKGKNKIIPVTIIEIPKMRIFSIRFYKDSKVKTEVLGEQLGKELKRKVKLPKTQKKKLDSIEGEFDDLRLIVYSLVNKTGLKKTPDLMEVGLSGSYEDKLNFVKENVNKELSVADVFDAGQLVDVRGLTKGKGLQGPVKRFGIQLKNQKSEKGRRRPGSIGPWHPARVIFRVPMAGQLGMFTRAHYNHKIIDLGKAEGKFTNIKNYGDVKTDYIVVQGSVQGPAKRQLVFTQPLRPSKKQSKKEYELIEYR